ncbi:hypothetical protein [Kibdelosporangium phytohabitans]|nr:hypothetical protein [Kibdelosporangium phytohabitans]MBE1468908.1 hypothetical protein [Kibdelosporangium phytohabitans]
MKRLVIPFVAVLFFLAAGVSGTLWVLERGDTAKSPRNSPA